MIAAAFARPFGETRISFSCARTRTAPARIDAGIGVCSVGVLMQEVLLTHLGTFHENAHGVAFFERMGFRRYEDPHLVPGFRLRSGGRMHVQLMVQPLGAAAGPP